MKKILAILLFLSLTHSSFASDTIQNVSMSNLTYSDGPLQTTFNVTASNNFFLDNGYNVQQTGYVMTSSQARAVFSTTASSITVSMYNNGMFTNYGSNGYCSIAVLVNGSNQGQINCTVSGAETQTFSLGSFGAKTVELRNGFDEDRNNSGNIFGTFLTSITFNGDQYATQINSTLSPTKRIVIYGDSITCGAASPIPSQDGWPMLLRNYYGPTGSVAMEAVSANELHYDIEVAGTPASMAAHLTSFCTGYSPCIIWIEHGHNDWGDSGGNLWSASSFGTAYGTLLDDIHSDLSTAIVYAQTPIVSSTQTDANTFGNNLADYRSAITTACNARSSFCTTADFSTVLTTGQLADGTHPLESAMPTYFNAVKAELGI